jgi:hypothetical protein
MLNAASTSTPAQPAGLAVKRVIDKPENTGG